MKFEPNFLTWLPKGKTKKTSVSVIFLTYSIFNNRNQISLSSRKVYDNFIKMTGKRWGAHARW